VVEVEDSKHIVVTCVAFCQLNGIRLVQGLSTLWMLPDRKGFFLESPKLISIFVFAFF
jgi:hypothetical protein